MGQDQGSPDSYEQLRQWYLARLRYLSEEEANRTMATPASRIASDKLAIQQLVASGVMPRIEGPKKASRSILLPGFILSWFLMQAFCLVALVLQESSFMPGLTHYLELTFMSLAPFFAPPSFATIPDRLTFLAFFVFPLILLVFLPPGQLRLPKHTFFRALSSQLSVKIALLALLVLVCVYVMIAFQGAAAPEAISLAGETQTNPTEGYERCLLAWGSLLLWLPIFSLKKQQNEVRSILDRVLSIQKEVRSGDGKEAFERPPEDDLNANLTDLETSIQEILQRERAIADFSKTVLICFDKSMRIEAISMSCFMQWGYYQHELIGQNLAYIVFHEDFRAFSESLSSGKSSIEQYGRIRKGDSTIMDCNWYIDWSTRLQKYFASCEDISDRMNLERARNDFIAQLTHDMRSPLSGVNMILEMIDDYVFGDLSPRMHNSIKSARESLNRVLQLINDILDAERLRHSKQTLEVGSIDIAHACNAAMEEVLPLAVDRKVKLGFKYQSENISVRADEKLLRRVLVNLLSNAVSFSQNGQEVNVTVSISSDSAMIKVIDSGPGIHHDYHRVIFERFGAPKMTTVQRPSTGIGLSICRDIIVAHGGLIGVESELGKGSTFWFTIPLDRRKTTTLMSS